MATTRGNNGKRKPLTTILTFLTCASCKHVQIQSDSVDSDQPR